MALSGLKIFLGRMLGWMLSKVVASNNPVIQLSERLFRAVVPHLVAPIAYRRGELSEAKALSSKYPTSPVYQKASQMVAWMQNGAVPMPPSKAVQPYNGRVLFVVHSNSVFDPNGYAVRTQHILNALDHAGVQTIVTTRLGYPWDLDRHARLPDQASSEVDGHRYLHRRDDLGMKRPEQEYFEAYAAYLEEIVVAEDCSIIHSHSNFLNGIATAMAGRRTGRRTIYEMRGLWHLTRASTDAEYGKSEHFRYCEFMEVQAARWCDQVVAISDALKQWLEQRGIPSEKISVIGNAADPLSESIQLPRTFPQQQGKLHIGYIGALTRYEGLDVLLEAVARIRHNGVLASVTIAGSGAYEEYLTRKARELRLRDVVTFLGRVLPSDVGALYNSFDLCVLARRRFDVTSLVQPLKPFEIMAHGLPIIVSNLPPLVEVVPDGKRGLVCEADDPEDLAIRIRFALENPDHVLEMARQAHHWVSEEATWLNNQDKYLRAYKASNL